MEKILHHLHTTVADPQIEFFLGFFLGNFPKGSASADRNFKISAAQIEIFHPAKPSADRNF